MNVLDKMYKSNSSITVEEIHANKDLEIYLCNKDKDKYKIMRAERKESDQCPYSSMKKCNKISMDYCILFESKNSKRIWSCYIDTIKRV